MHALRIGRRGTVAIVFALACGADASQAPVLLTPDPASAPASVPLAIVDVTVIPIDREGVDAHRTVIVGDGRIAEIGPSSTVTVPAGATVIDGRTRYLMPGFTDMHAHMRTADLNAYLAAGITSVRNMWGHSGIAPLQRRIASGEVAGPTIYSASPGVDAPPSPWPEPELLSDPALADATVARLKAAGWLWIKVYSGLSPAVYDALVVAAKKNNIALVGHVPLAVDVRTVLAGGQRSIEHMGGYDRIVSASRQTGTWGWIDARPETFAELAATTQKAQTWNCPTLAIYSEIARQQHTAAQRTSIVANRRAFVLALERAGAELLIGTDAGIDVVPAGTSFHDEMQEFVDAGLSPARVLHLATVDAARFLGDESIGHVAVGARADLVLLARSPLEAITNTRAIEGVVLRGAWINKATLSTH